MKRTHAKQSFTALLAGFFLFGLMLFGSTDAAAQVNNINYKWKQSDEAKSALITETQTITASLPNLSGAALNAAKAHVYYYRSIVNQIITGTEVGQAAISSLTIFDAGHSVDNTTYQDVSVDQTLKNQLFQDAVNLLKP